MKFGLMYEVAMPKPWYEGQEHEKYWQVMAQIEHAEEMGFDYTWAQDYETREPLDIELSAIEQSGSRGGPAIPL